MDTQTVHEAGLTENETAGTAIARVDLAFRGLPIPAVMLSGKMHWVARQVGRVVSPEDDGKSFVEVASDAEAIEDTDYLRVSGATKASVLAALRESGNSPLSSGRGGGAGKSLVLLTESGLNLALMRSRSALGKAMRRWLASEVIPSIRRAGAYVTPRNDNAELIALRSKVKLLEDAFARPHGLLGPAASYEVDRPLRRLAWRLSSVQGRPGIRGCIRHLRNKLETGMGWRDSFELMPASPARMSKLYRVLRRLERDVLAAVRLGPLKPDHQQPLFTQMALGAQMHVPEALRRNLEDDAA